MRLEPPTSKSCRTDFFSIDTNIMKTEVSRNVLGYPAEAATDIEVDNITSFTIDGFIMALQ